MLIVALGVGAATAVFSVSETLLLRPLPYPDGDRLVTLRSISPDPAFPYERAAPGTLADWQIESTLFEATAGYRWHTIDAVGAGESESLHGLFVTPEFFVVFGVPLVGRGFQAEDRGTRAIVLGYDVWRRRFDADQAIVGGTLDLNVRNLKRVGPTRHTVVGLQRHLFDFRPLLPTSSLVLRVSSTRLIFGRPSSSRRPARVSRTDASSMSSQNCGRV